MPQIIPLQPLPAQTLEALLGDQATSLEIRQLSTGLYMNILVSSIEIVGFTLCENFNRIVRNSYLGFSGDLIFIDNTGQGRDPTFDGLGTDYSLVYLSVADLPAGLEG